MQRILSISFVLTVALALIAFQPAAQAAGHQRDAGTKKGKNRAAKKAKRRARRHSAYRARVAESSAVAGSSASSSTAGGDTLIDANFEQGNLMNWNIAGVGEVVPTVTTEEPRDGAYAGRVVLTGNQGRSELGLSGDGTREPGTVEFREGDEYWYGFSFNIKQMVYGGPGGHNLIMQFHQQGEGSPNFGLQLWDYEGDDGVSGGKGLWTHGGAPGGDRFLSPVSENAWHDIAIHFKASSRDAGFYETYLDGRLVDSRSGISMIMPGFESAYIKTGLYRNGETVAGTSELLIDDGKLGTTASSVQPG